MTDQRTMLEYKVDLYGTHFTGLTGLMDETPATDDDAINDIAVQLISTSSRLAQAQADLDHFDRIDARLNNYGTVEQVDPLNTTPELGDFPVRTEDQKKEENWALVAMREREEEIKQEEKVAVGSFSSTIRYNKYHVTDGTTKVRVRYSHHIQHTPTSYDDQGRTDVVGVNTPVVTLYAKDYCDGLGILFGDLYINHTDSMTDYFDKGKVVLEEGHPGYESALARSLAWEDQLAAAAKVVPDTLERDVHPS